jgi:hypothetical protein
MESSARSGVVMAGKTPDQSARCMGVFVMVRWFSGRWKGRCRGDRGRRDRGQACPRP